MNSNDKYYENGIPPSPTKEDHFKNSQKKAERKAAYLQIILKLGLKI